MAILGVDEVGRGPLAGPLVVGAVILPEKKPRWVDELCDSKKLSAKRREELSRTIRRSKAAAVGLGWVASGEIDRLGMIRALELATRRAVKAVQAQHEAFSQIVIDGNINFLEGTALEKYTSTVIKGDDLIKEISAASIVAKVARDRYMANIAREYPEYGFERHSGYGTDLHRQMIRQNGLCPEHRRLVKLVRDAARREGEDLDYVWRKDVRKNTTSLGARGESAVCEYLADNGHMILMRNFKTRFCEIDIISVHEGRIYFTEVKYRKSDAAGGGLAAVDAAKLERMRFAAECFLKFRPELKDKYDPMLAVADVAGEDFVVREWMPLDS